jgi:hypothetical protein
VGPAPHAPQLGYHGAGAAELEAAIAAATAAAGSGTATSRRAAKKAEAAAAAAAATAGGGRRTCSGIPLDLDERDIVIPASAAHDVGIMSSFLMCARAPRQQQQQ